MVAPAEEEAHLAALAACGPCKELPAAPYVRPHSVRADTSPIAVLFSAGARRWGATGLTGGESAARRRDSDCSEATVGPPPKAWRTLADAPASHEESNALDEAEAARSRGSEDGH